MYPSSHKVLHVCVDGMAFNFLFIQFLLDFLLFNTRHHSLPLMNSLHKTEAEFSHVSCNSWGLPSFSDQFNFFTKVQTYKCLKTSKLLTVFLSVWIISTFIFEKKKIFIYDEIKPCHKSNTKTYLLSHFPLKIKRLL